MKRAYVDIPEGQVHYQVSGSGTPLLLLHQSPLSSDEYVKMMPILAKSCRVIAMDTLGYGKSDFPPRPYEISDYALSVVNFLKALGINKTSIFGHHTGASIAVEVAVTHPEMVDQLILSACPNFTPKMRESRFNDPRFRPMEIKEDGSHLLKVWQNYGSVYEPRPSLETRQMAFANYMMAGATAENAHYSAFRYEAHKRLPLIKSSALVLCGDRDTQYGTFENTKSLIPRCQAKIIKGAGVLITLDKPEELAEIVLGFLKSPGRGCNLSDEGFESPSTQRHLGMMNHK